MKPLLDYLSGLEDTQKAPTVTSFKHHFRMEGKTGDGESWTCIGLKDALDDLPHELLNLKIDGDLMMEVSTTKKRELNSVTFEGWFVGDGAGHWTIWDRSSWYERGGKYEVPMYDWYQLKQCTSKVADDFLSRFTDQGA